jgi:hypothetical protein
MKHTTLPGLALASLVVAMAACDPGSYERGHMVSSFAAASSDRYIDVGQVKQFDAEVIAIGVKSGDSGDINASSDNPAIAEVLNWELIPSGKGPIGDLKVLRVAVRGVSPGGATITATGDLNLQDAYLDVFVREPAAPAPPALADLPGRYRLEATKTTDSCPAGAFANALDETPMLQLTTDPGVLELRSTARVRSPYDETTGLWLGVGQTEMRLGVETFRLRQSITGNWESGPPIRMQAPMLYELFTTDGSTKLCEAHFNASLTRL